MIPEGIETYTCDQCTMGFRIEDKATVVSESHKCPDCQRIFWSAGASYNHIDPRCVLVGISPSDISDGEWVPR